MKVVDGNAGLLTNFEVLDLLQRKGVGRPATSTAHKVHIHDSEKKVAAYLLQTCAGVQTRESIAHLFEATDKFGLTKAEKLQVVNNRPASAVEAHLLVEDCEERLKEGQHSRVNWEQGNACDEDLELCFGGNKQPGNRIEIWALDFSVRSRVFMVPDELDSIWN
eukprot:jgi/Mesvir1/28610/Mv01025-RA.1